MAKKQRKLQEEKGQFYYLELFETVYDDNVHFFGVCKRKHFSEEITAVYEVESQIVAFEDNPGYMYYRPLYDRQKEEWLFKFDEECYFLPKDRTNTDEEGIPLLCPIQFNPSKNKFYCCIASPDMKKIVKPILCYSGNPLNDTQYKTLGECCWTWRKLHKKDIIVDQNRLA